MPKANPKSGTEKLTLTVGADHVKKLAKLRKPIVAIEELIWNALDADATRIDIALNFNALEGLESITVTDNGTGIPRETWEASFGQIGGSPKLKQRTTPQGREVHGQKGHGRFKALGLGTYVQWLSRYQKDGKTREYAINVASRNLEEVNAEPEQASTGKPGVTVTIEGITETLRSLTDVDNPVIELSYRLAPYLKRYPGIDIRYDGEKIDPQTHQKHQASYTIKAQTENHGEVEADLEIIEWDCNADRALYLCNAEGFTRHRETAGIQAKGFQFTAYLRSAIFEDLNEDDTISLSEMHPDVVPMVESAREKMREHFRQRASELEVEQVQKWKDEGIYPYGSEVGEDPVAQVSREVFNICAIQVNENLPDFTKSDAKSKRLTFRLIKEALERNPSSLQLILHEVLSLPAEQQEKLAELLTLTKLSSIINATKTVTDRLQFLESLNDLLYGEYETTLNEPRNLQPILAKNLWIFGEQYLLGVNEGGLTTLLKEHLGILERTDFVGETVKNLDGKSSRVDLMLYASLPSQVESHYEHLVIDLKRPTVKIGQKEIGQIERYGLTVAADPRFDKARTVWKFIMVSNEFDDFAEAKSRQSNKESGHLHISDSVNIYIKKWSELIQAAKWRYRFFREQLELEITRDQSLEHLRKNYADLLPDGKS